VDPAATHHPEPDGLTPATAAAFDADVPGALIAPGGGEYLPIDEIPPESVHEAEPSA
jgi:hypothetical protein